MRVSLLRLSARSQEAWRMIATQKRACSLLGTDRSAFAPQVVAVTGLVSEGDATWLPRTTPNGRYDSERSRRYARLVGPHGTLMGTDRERAHRAHHTRGDASAWT